MTLWKLAAIAAIATVPANSHAQDSSFPMPDYNATIGDAAQGAATMAAARGRGSATRSSRPRSRANANAAAASRARSQCTKARGWAADGVDHPNLPRVLQMCERNGY